MDAGAPDEASELLALARAVALATNFKLLLARYRGEVHRQHLEQTLREMLPQRRLLQLRLHESVTHLLDFLRAELPADPPALVLVSGFEAALPVPREAEHSELVANLNATRDFFPSLLPCPLLLWLPDYVLVAMARGAPDFFSGRSHAFHFDAGDPALGELSRLLAESHGAARLLELKAKIFAYLDQRPVAESRPEPEARLLADLGVALAQARVPEEGMVCDLRALEIYGDAAPAGFKARALQRIAEAQRGTGRASAARSTFDLAVTVAAQAGLESLTDRALEPATQARAAELRGVSDPSRRDVAVELGRDAQWRALLGELEKAGNSVLLLYGQRQQRLQLFIDRARRHLSTRGYLVLLLSPALIDSGELLRWMDVPWVKPGSLFILQLTLGKLSLEEWTALTSFLTTALPARLQEQTSPARVLLTVELDAPGDRVRLQRLVKILSQASARGPRFLALPEVTPPRWEEIAGFLRSTDLSGAQVARLREELSDERLSRLDFLEVVARVEQAIDA